MGSGVKAGDTEKPCFGFAEALLWSWGFSAACTAAPGVPALNPVSLSTAFFDPFCSLVLKQFFGHPCYEYFLKWNMDVLATALDHTNCTY